MVVVVALCDGCSWDGGVLLEIHISNVRQTVKLPGDNTTFISTCLVHETESFERLASEADHLTPGIIQNNRCPIIHERLRKYYFVFE